MQTPWKCTYSKTYNGNCDQAKQLGKDTCYYHTKVEAGHIETDEQSVIGEMPLIVL